MFILKVQVSSLSKLREAGLRTLQMWVKWSKILRRKGNYRSKYVNPGEFQ